MSMMKLQSKEHLVYFMQCGMMNLSSYDLKFVQNLNILIAQKNPITSNQITLLEKLLSKYKRQFSKHKYNLEFIQSLPWHSAIIQSTSEYTEAYLSITDGKIYLRCPFNKKFITALRQVSNNPFKWDRENKRYESLFSTYSLKIIYNLVSENYSTVNYCEVTKQLLNKVNQYAGNLIWQPTLIKSNDLLLIGATNKFVDEATKNIKLDLSDKTVFKLSSYGVGISDELAKDPKLSFASSTHVEIDMNDLFKIFQWLYELGCDCILFSGLTVQHIKNNVHKHLLELGIDYYSHRDVLFTTNKMVTESYNFIASVHFTSVKINPSMRYKDSIKKIIKVHNSQPINIK